MSAEFEQILAELEARTKATRVDLLNASAGVGLLVEAAQMPSQLVRDLQAELQTRGCFLCHFAQYGGGECLALFPTGDAIDAVQSEILCLPVRTPLSRGRTHEQFFSAATAAICVEPVCRLREHRSGHAVHR